MTRTKAKATVRLLVNADTYDDAYGRICDLLNDVGLNADDAPLLSWEFVADHDNVTGPRPVAVPDGFDRDIHSIDILEEED